MDTVLALHPEGLGSQCSGRSILSMLLSLIDSSTASIKWTLQKLNNVNRTYLVLLDGATKKTILY